MTRFPAVLWLTLFLVACDGQHGYDPSAPAGERMRFLYANRCEQLLDDLPQIALYDGDATIQLRAARRLRACNHPAYVPVLHRLVDAEDEALRWWVGMWLYGAVRRGPLRRLDCPGRHWLSRMSQSLDREDEIRNPYEFPAVRWPAPVDSPSTRPRLKDTMP